MNLIILTREQADLAAFRYREHGNSAHRITRHFRRLDDETSVRVCRTLRKVERRFGINLGTVCFKFLEKETRPTSAFQQQVMDYIAHWRDREDGTRDLVVSVDRARMIDRLAQGETEWLTLRDS